MKRNHILPVFLVIQIVFLKILSFFPELVERWYSNGMYVVISKILRTVLGQIPFSVGDVLYLVLILIVMFRFWKTRNMWLVDWKDQALKVVGFVSVVYFLFHILWALNYYRVPLSEKMNIQREYSEADLIAFTEKLIAKTNTVQLEITKNKNNKVSVPYSEDFIFELSQNGYDHLANQHHFIEYEFPSRKKSLLSVPLTYMGFGGYLNPFTNEAQVNDQLPLYGFPNVVCHEMAHQIGYGSESECNFIGFLACIKNEDLYFNYSAYAAALKYCMANIKAKNEAKFEELKKTIHPGVLANYKESDDFWKQYDTFIDQGFHLFYDQFLKMNQQKDGLESYSKYVDLLVNYYRGKEF